MVCLLALEKQWGKYFPGLLDPEWSVVATFDHQAGYNILIIIVLASLDMFWYVLISVAAGPGILQRFMMLCVGCLLHWKIWKLAFLFASTSSLHWAAVNLWTPNFWFQDSSRRHKTWGVFRIIMNNRCYYPPIDGGSTLLCEPFFPQSGRLTVLCQCI